MCNPEECLSRAFLAFVKSGWSAASKAVREIAHFKSFFSESICLFGSMWNIAFTTINRQFKLAVLIDGHFDSRDKKIHQQRKQFSHGGSCQRLWHCITHLPAPHLDNTYNLCRQNYLACTKTPHISPGDRCIFNLHLFAMKNHPHLEFVGRICQIQGSTVFLSTIVRWKPPVCLCVHGSKSKYSLTFGTRFLFCVAATSQLSRFSTRFPSLNSTVFAGYQDILSVFYF